MVLKNSKLSKKGFTIVELLVVIVVIGILAAITVVSYTGVTNRAKASRVDSSANQIVRVAEAIAVDNAGTYPVTTGQFASMTSTVRLPASGITIGVTAPTSSTGETTFQLFTSTTAGAAKGGRVVFWDYEKNNLCTATSGNANGSTADSCYFWGVAKSTDTFAIFAS